MLELRKNGSIIICRGDSFNLPLLINEGTATEPRRYVLTGNDKVYVGVMEVNQKFEDAIIKKVYTAESEKTDEGDVIVKFLSKDTENLYDGMYKYSIKLQKYSDDENYSIHTIIPERDFVIKG